MDGCTERETCEMDGWVGEWMDVGSDIFSYHVEDSFVDIAWTIPIWGSY